MVGIEREPAEVRIPKTALDAFAAALSVRTVAMRTWPDGIEWMYPLGTWEEPHLEVALMPGGDELAADVHRPFQLRRVDHPAVVGLRRRTARRDVSGLSRGGVSCS
ncbi:hypothetical protein [Streptomyces sp. NPDC048473]|uniref:hypothetical protein n=1 Tax=Streptomyces sp. NPDC048473 TaxID=3365556 RepID=UPI003712BB8A